MTNLGDLPPELITLIAERADTRSRCSLRNCSKSLHEIVINTKHVCKQIIVDHDEHKQVSIKVNDNTKCVYVAVNGGCEIQKEQPLGDIKTFLNEESYLEVAVDDLMKVLKDPNIMVKKLQIEGSYSRSVDIDPFITLLSQKLTRLSHRLHVEKFTPWNLTESDMIGILPCFEPRTLKVLDFIELRPSDRFAGIVHLEQWKKAQKLRSIVLPPMGELLHFKRVEVCAHLMGSPLVPWDELKSFIEKVMAQSEPTQFICNGFQAPNEFYGYARDVLKMKGTDKVILKELEDGSQLVLISFYNYIEIRKSSSYQ